MMDSIGIFRCLKLQSFIAFLMTCLFLTVCFSGTRSDEIYSGIPHIIDGDTLIVEGERVRLHGIDAPEQKQSCSDEKKNWACGRAATDTLARVTSGKVIKCHGKKRDKYKRLIAVCFLQEINLNAYMVNKGWALAYRRYSKEYISEELEAKSRLSGMWRGDFIAPWDWRKR